MRQIEIQTGCKANLFLKITGKRVDGYHTLQSLFIPLSSPSDSMCIWLEHPEVQDNGLIIESNVPELERGNILFDVYELIREEFGYAPGLKMRLSKRIPMGSGLGGGSADGAAFLRFLIQQLPESVRPDGKKVLEYAQRLGADFPFFLVQQPAFVQGVGEQIEIVPCNLRGKILIVICPQVMVSTKWAYEAWDAWHCSVPAGGTRTEGKLLTTEEIRYRKMLLLEGRLLFNDFEGVVFSRFPELYDLKLWSLAHGAKGVTLSGSGASLVALFDRSLADGFICDLEKQGLDFFVNIL